MSSVIYFLRGLLKRLVPPRLEANPVPSLSWSLFAIREMTLLSENNVPRVNLLLVTRCDTRLNLLACFMDRVLPGNVHRVYNEKILMYYTDLYILVPRNKTIINVGNNMYRIYDVFKEPLIPGEDTHKVAPNSSCPQINSCFFWGGGNQECY